MEEERKKKDNEKKIEYVIGKRQTVPIKRTQTFQ